jgi:hypothetical protein
MSSAFRITLSRSDAENLHRGLIDAVHEAESSAARDWSLGHNFGHLYVTCDAALERMRSLVSTQRRLLGRMYGPHRYRSFR